MLESGGIKLIGLEEKNKIVTGFHKIGSQVLKFYEEVKEFDEELKKFFYDRKDKCIEKLMLEAADAINMIIQVVEHYGGTEEQVLSYRHNKMTREVKRVNKAIETGVYEKA